MEKASGAAWEKLMYPQVIVGGQTRGVHPGDIAYWQVKRKGGKYDF